MVEVHRAAGKMGMVEVHRAAGKMGTVKVDLAAGEMGTAEAPTEVGRPEVDRAAGEMGVIEADLAPRELGAPEMYLAAGEMGIAEVDLAAGELGVIEVDRGPRELGTVEVDRSAGELDEAEVDLAAGEMGAAEVDLVGELDIVEVDRAAGEMDAGEIAAVKDYACEVEVQALPGHHSVFSEVRGDDPDDGVADFADGLEGKSLRLGSVLARIRLVWHAAAAAVAVIAGLVGAARERVISPSPFPSLTVVVAASRLQAFSAIQPAQLRIEHRGWSPFLSGPATTSKQVTGHALLTDVPAGQTVPVSQIGPVVPPQTVALSATLSPAESLAAQVGPGDLVDLTPVCSGQPRDSLIGLAAVKVLDVRDTSATPGSLPASMTVVLAIPASVAAQAARALLDCKVALTPGS